MYKLYSIFGTSASTDKIQKLILELFVILYFFSFASNYKNRVWRNEVMMRKQERGVQEKKGTGKHFLS